MKTIRIRHVADRWPVEYITINDNTPAHRIVEIFQGKLRAAGLPDDVEYRVTPGGFVDAILRSEEPCIRCGRKTDDEDGLCPRCSETTEKQWLDRPGGEMTGR